MTQVSSRTNLILSAYEAWDPESSNLQELLDEIGISRQRLYQVLAANGVIAKTRRHRRNKAAQGDLLSEMADLAFQSILDQLVELRVEVRELRDEVAGYRAKYGPLD